MSQNYTPESKKKIVRLHKEEGRTYKSITAEYGVSKASISKWCSEFSRECQTSPQAKEDYDSMKENLRLKREDDGLRKEIASLKKAAAFFAEEIGQRLTDLLTNIIRSSVSAGSCGDRGSARMPTTTTGRQIIMPKKRRFRSRSATSTTAMMEWTATAA